MIRQLKDTFYEEFLKEPTKDKFRELIKNNFGELDEFDFKKQWIDKEKIAKLILAMANSRGGIIVFGIGEKEDGTFEPIGLTEFKDPAEINDSIAKDISPNLNYEILDFKYDQSEYKAVENKKFQILLVYDTPEKLPFFSLGQTDELEKDVIYIRRGTKSEKATYEEIEKIIYYKIQIIFKESSDLNLDEHLLQLKKLYEELPKKIKVLVRKGEPSYIRSLQKIGNILAGYDDEYEERDNPSYPEESYEAFILRMIKYKKLKIEKVLDLK